MNTNKTIRRQKMPNPNFNPTKKNIFRATIESWYYMAENILYYLFYKKWVDRKIKEDLSRKYKKDDVIIVAVHGFCEYYWQSFTKYMEYFDKRGKVIIPFEFDYIDPDIKTVEKLAKEVQYIQDKTKAKIVLMGDSVGAIIIGKYLFKYNPSFVKENIPVAGLYDEYKKCKGIAFWARWLIKTPKEEIAEFAKILKTTKIPKTKIALYGKYDIFILPTELRYLPTVNNICFYTGHFGTLYDLEVIRFVYEHIFGNDRNGEQ